MYSNCKICATVEARMGSTRLPGKVLFMMEGKPVLQHIIERLKRSKYIDDIIVATTVNERDLPIVQLCEKLGCKYYQGSEDDVLLRVLEAAKSVNADMIVEITGDCPVIDWRHADYLIELFFSGKYDYVSNTIEKSFPDGFDIQVFPVSVLQEVNNLTQNPVDHEHVSIYIYTHPEKYRLGNWKADGIMRHPDYEITLDTIEDYELIKEIYHTLYSKNQDFSGEDVIELIIEHPELLNKVKKIKRKNAIQEQQEWIKKKKK
ncbi:MAG: hypothetical protein A2V66_14815 [Ignavibacteria bacterium RBG_13_36_8]|nr:MAG: hypothetical protein A2V66_14815 [Ignavibacteria bacterium RBG_13_36_8]